MNVHWAYLGAGIQVTLLPFSIGDNPSVAADSRYKLIEFQEGTEVQMGDLTREIIEAYVDTGEPM